MAAAHELPSDLPLLEQAAIWFDRLSSNLVSSEELEEFERWRATPDNNLAFAEIEAAYADARSAANASEMLALRHEALTRIVMPYARRKRRTWVGGAIAASLAVIASVGVWDGQLDTANRRTSQIASIQPAIYQTAVGEQLTVSLPDGSNVSLNTDSRLRLAYTNAERRLILEKGQALFHVAKGQLRPFIVQALDHIVTAHGTTFDVRIASDRKVKVALVEGVVSVAETRRGAPPPVKLQPKDVLIASDDKASVTRDPQVEHEISWREGMIFFEDETLEQATSEVNRYVQTPIILRDERLKEIRISGAFRTGETGAFIEALQAEFPVRVVERGNDKIVLGYRS